MDERTRSDEPEPIPQRELGYYWVRRPCADAPEVAEYCATTMRDQLLDEHGKLSDREIVCGYTWVFCGDDAADDDPDLCVLSQRLLPPAS